MAENVNITPGTGDVVAADDIAGVKHQRVKISQGVDGSATDVSSTDPLNVTLANTGANSTAIKVDGSSTTQPISVSTLPLPSGAATAAKQPALGTAGTASSDVLTVQGITSMTALKVDGSGVTQPVSGTVSVSGVATASNQTTGNTSLSSIDTKLTDGTQKAIVAGDVASGATDSGNPVKVAGKYNTTMPTFTDGQRGDIQLTTRGAVKTTLFANDSNTTIRVLADNADTVATTSTGNALAIINRNTVYNGTSWDRQYGTATDGAQVYVKGTATDNGLLASKVICAASTNATSVKASAGKIYRVDAFNSDTVGYWVKFYNKASAPTVGTDVPVATKYVPAGGGFVIESTVGIPYTTGIALAATVNATDADTTAVTTANKLVINLRYV
jgi:hypothetical protein